MKPTIDQILKERGPKHGPAQEQFECAQNLKNVINKWVGSHGVLDPMQKEALDMVTTKISRIIVGDAEEIDHWDDIAGYATLVSKNIEKRARDNASADLPPLPSEERVDVALAT